MQWCRWFRHCATRRRVAGSIAYVFIGIFLLTLSLRSHYGPGVDSTSNRNEYQGYFLGGKGGRYVGLTKLSPSCADCLEMWKPQTPAALGACTGISLPVHKYSGTLLWQSSISFMNSAWKSTYLRSILSFTTEPKMGWVNTAYKRVKF
jgi:hypothetical protein